MRSVGLEVVDNRVDSCDFSLSLLLTLSSNCITRPVNDHCLILSSLYLLGVVFHELTSLRVSSSPFRTKIVTSLYIQTYIYTSELLCLGIIKLLVN